MWFFGKKKKEAVSSLDLSWLGIDVHSHLLPGVDDGVPDISASLELIRGLQNLGYKKIITTPHVLWEIYPNTTERITEALTTLQDALHQESINIELHAAAEYFIDEHFTSELNNKVPLLTISGNMVLVEFSLVSVPLDLQQVLFEMQVQNYQPVIAHPERYVYLSHHKEVFDELKNAGCLFQLNLLSLTGYYGRAVKELAEYLCKKNYYNLAGTDMHHKGHLAALPKLSSSSLLQRLKEAGVLKNAQL